MSLKISVTLFLSSLSFLAMAQKNNSVEERVSQLLAKMIVEEKIGQLNLYSGDRLATGPLNPNSNKYNEIKEGEVGSMLNVQSAQARLCLWIRAQLHLI